MTFKVCSLRSGSKGNSTLIMTDKTALLVDCGISISTLKNELMAFNLTPNDLSGVLITHEHTDHIYGLNKLPKNVSVICHQNTYCELNKKYELSYFNSPNFDLGFEIEDLSVLPFRIPHDAKYTVGYSFYKNGTKVSIATDIGHITDGIVNNLKGCDLMLIESNHDEKMLNEGSYPYYLKKRILGSHGHLSNYQSGELLKKVYSPRLKALMLGHLSEENNKPELALNTAQNVLNDVSSLAKTEVCSQHKSSRVFEV